MINIEISTLDKIAQTIIIGAFLIIATVAILQSPVITSIWVDLPIGRVPPVWEGYLNFIFAIITFIISGVIETQIDSE